MPEITSRLSTALADRYKIERHLGEGGMATVYLAEDLKHKRKVAVKVLRPELAAVLGAERFVQEITTTANLQHPHILPLFDSGEADGFLYYVMPFIDGETLRDKLNRETQLGIEEAVSITTAIADALDYAHRHNVIHRDIKPENILLHEGRPMVADFGISMDSTWWSHRAADQRARSIGRCGRSRDSFQPDHPSRGSWCHLRGDWPPRVHARRWGPTGSSVRPAILGCYGSRRSQRFLRTWSGIRSIDHGSL